MNNYIKILMIAMVLIGTNVSIAVAADSKAEVEAYLREKLTKDEYDIMKRIKSVSDMPYSDIFKGYIEPLREGTTPEELPKEPKPAVVPTTKGITVSQDTDKEKPISVKGVDAKKRAKELSVDTDAEVMVDEEAIAESIDKKSKPKSKSMREKLDEAKYQEQLDKRKTVTDRIEEVDRSIDRRRGLGNFNRKGKKNRFGAKRLDVGKDGLPVEDAAEGYHVDGFKEKPFGSKKARSADTADPDAEGFDVFADKKSSTGFNKRKQRKGEYRRPERKKFNVRDRDE